jgi:hypothetical protein
LTLSHLDLLVEVKLFFLARIIEILLTAVVPSSSSSSSCYLFMALWMVGQFRNFYSAQQARRRRIFKSEQLT